jgi:AcrR family transcriptional regulator
VDDITEKADVAKGTFFNYFARKEAILGYLWEARFLEVEANADTFILSKGSAREKLIRLYMDLAAAYQGDKELSWFVLQESVKRAFRPEEDMRRRAHALVNRIVTHGMETREFRADLDQERVAAVLGSVYMGTLFMWLGCAPGTFDLNDELTARLSLVFDGFAA